YLPEAQASQIDGVEFWIHQPFGRWYDGGPARVDGDGRWTSTLLLGEGDQPFHSAADEISVHVAWPSGTQWIDPTPWATEFQSIPATGISTPTPELLPMARPASVAEPNHGLTPGATFDGASAMQVCTSGWAS